MSQNNSNDKILSLQKISSIHQVEGFNPEDFVVEFTDLATKIANALGVSVDQLIIADSKYPELIYLREISEKLQSYPLSTRILACEMIRDMLEVLDRAQFDNSHLK